MIVNPTLFRTSVILPAGALLALQVQGIRVLRNEWTIHLIEQKAAAQEENPVPFNDQPLPLRLPARGALAAAIMLARQAAAQPAGNARTLLLSRAQLLNDQVLAVRPTSGEAWLVNAYLAGLRDGLDSPAALSAFARSYRFNGYLRKSADWRLRYAAIHWNALDAETRRRAAMEGRWLSLLTPALRLHTFVLVGGTPLYEAIAGPGAHAPKLR